MATPQRTLHLNAFLMSTGHHEASWRLPESNPRAGTEISHYVNLARIAERGTFDSIFFADSPVIFGDVGRRPAAGRQAGTYSPADRHRGRDGQDRADRHRVNDVQRSV